MSAAPMQVLVAGGGVAGLEACLALRDLAGDRVQCTLLTPEEEFVYRPMAVAEPFARGLAQRQRLDRIAEDAGAKLVAGTLASVDDRTRTAVTTDGDRLDYDALIAAVSARTEPVLARAVTWTPEPTSRSTAGCCATSRRATANGWRSWSRSTWPGRCRPTSSR